MISTKTISTARGEYVRFIQIEQYEIEQIPERIEQWHVWLVRPDGSRCESVEAGSEEEAVKIAHQQIVQELTA